MTDRDENGRFLPGNRFWEARSSAGPKPKFSRAEDLWEACCEYFEWNEENPLQEGKLTSYQGVSEVVAVPKMRAMTISALCMYLDVSHSQWIQWRENRTDLQEVISRAEEIIKRQKFEGASADLLNPNIIARDLGLRDKSHVEHSGTLDINAEAAAAEDKLGAALAAEGATDLAEQSDTDGEDSPKL